MKRVHPGTNFPLPNFEQEIVTERLRSGYWVEAVDIDRDGYLDLVGYGMSVPEIYWYKNGRSQGTSASWSKNLVVDRIDMPVGMDSADITGNGFPDLVVCYDLYGDTGTFRDPSADGGRIDWLENPGDSDVPVSRWRRHYVGQFPAMHRLKIGYFTQREKLEIIGFPIVSTSHMHGLLNVVLFAQPDDPLSAESWTRTTIDDSYFRFVHGVEKKANLIKDSDLDSLIVASDEGVTWLYFDVERREWVKKLIGKGEHSQVERTSFKGSGDADVGRVGEDRFAYVAAVEPFHGNTVVVYVRDTSGINGDWNWRRHVLDIYSDPNEGGESPGHCVVCADFDGDGEEEFLVGLRGPEPWQGVMYYKAVDLQNGVFVKWRVASESVARIAIGDFAGRGAIDFATIGYAIDNYYVADNPKIAVYHNRVGSTDSDNEGTRERKGAAPPNQS